MIFVVVMLSLSLISCGSDKSKGTITVGSKDFTENILLAHMMADIIEENTELKVERKVNLGGSSIAWKALLNNEIQLYPEYTGTIVANYYQEKTGTSEETLAKTEELLKKDKIVLTNQFGFNNTYTLAVTKETADKYKLATFSDVAKISKDLILGCEFEFKDREDGYIGLSKTYGIDFKEVKGMNRGIMYRSVVDNEVDVIDAYATDGQIIVNDLVILEDDKAFFPPYDAGPLVRQDVLTKYPEITEALSKLQDVLDEKTMQELNARVDTEGLKAETVSQDFLKEKGLIK